MIKVAQEFQGMDEGNPSVQQALNFARLENFQKTQILVMSGFAITILVAISYLYFLEDSNPNLWFSTVPLVTIALFSTLVAFRLREQTRLKVVSHKASMIVSMITCVYGVTWGATIGCLAYLYPESSIFLLLIVVGASSSAMNMFYLQPLTAILCSLLAVSPVTIIICLLRPEIAWMILLLYGVYYYISITSVFVSFEILRNNLELRLLNEKGLKTSEESNESKADFIAAMSHELRTPLNAIIGYTQLMKLDGDKDHDDMNRGLDNVLHASQHLLALVDDILVSSKLEATLEDIEQELLTPSDVFQELIPLINESLQEKQINWEGVKKSGRYIRVNRHLLKQILLNLLNNAIKYTPEHGTIEFGCYETNDSILRIYVTDSGIGIPLSDQGQIFQQFYRAGNVKNVHPGTGLGLYHSRNLAEAMNGAMSFDSIESGGSTFYVDFPVTSFDANTGLSVS